MDSNKSILVSSDVKRIALDIGFHACGIAAAEPLSSQEFGLDSWLANGYHAGMGYMERNSVKRHNPSLLMPGAKSVIVILLGYKPSLLIDSSPRIAQYAYTTDYHTRIKEKLYKLAAILKQDFPTMQFKACVDTVPISDKLWAARAGLGWIGHNTLLINPTLGSFHNIGELVVNMPATQYNQPMANGCGECRRCISACLNKALIPTKNNHHCLNANRCTAYHTIENRTPTLPSGLNLGGYVFGCDRCQLVCPYNSKTIPKTEINQYKISQLESLTYADESTFNQLTKDTPLSRITYAQWQRNICFNRNQTGNNTHIC